MEGVSEEFKSGRIVLEESEGSNNVAIFEGRG